MAIDRVAPDFFTGIEVENSPAKDMPTLFVVGIQPVEKILGIVGDRNALLDTSKHIHHIYLGANMSLQSVADDDHYVWRQVDDMINGLLDNLSIEYITIDIDVNQIKGFLESMASENNRIIPMISVKLPYTRLLNYNTTVKIDDIGFNKTNPGVWCVPLGNLTKRKYYTTWSAYKGDNAIN